MSNKGTQLQVISLKYNNINLEDILYKSFEKFLGINCNRCWINQLSEQEQHNIVSFLTEHIDIILELIFKNGLCLRKEDKSSIFIINNSYYSKTKIIDPYIFTYEEIINDIIKNIFITKNGNLELCKQIGLQRKGSKNYLQFKDRGFTIDIIKYNSVKNKMSKKYNGLSLFSSAGIGETYIEPYVHMVVSNELLIERTRLYSHFYNNSHVIHGDITDKNIFDNIIKESLLRNVDYIRIFIIILM